MLKGKSQTEAAKEMEISIPILSWAERMLSEPTDRMKRKIERYYQQSWAEMYQRIYIADLL